MQIQVFILINRNVHFIKIGQFSVDVIFFNSYLVIDCFCCYALLVLGYNGTKNTDVG